MSAKKILQFRKPAFEPVRVTIVGDWRPQSKKEAMLRKKLLPFFDVETAKAVEAAREECRRKWCLGLTHVMPAEFTTKQLYRQSVAERWQNFQHSPDRTNWPESHALDWAHCKHHEHPLLYPCWHEQEMKAVRGSSIWGYLESADPRMVDIPEYRHLCYEAGFREGDPLPVIQLPRPYVPKPRQTASRGAKRAWKRQQVRCESIYGPGRRQIMKALKRRYKLYVRQKLGVISVA